MILIHERKKIALLYGGSGREHSVSVRSAEYVKGLFSPEKYELLLIYIDGDGRWLLSSDNCYEEVFPIWKGRLFTGKGFVQIDCALPLMHGDFGEDGRVQGALEIAQIPFIGSDTVTGAICIDKGITRLVATELGIPVARGKSLAVGENAEAAVAAAREVGFPVFVKPARLGSSIGATPARNESELLRAYEEASKYGSSVLIEELIESKRELEIGVLVTRGQIITSPVGEVLCADFYSFDKKYRSDTKTVCPAAISKKISGTLREWTLLLARTLGLRGPSRLDFFLSEGRLLFNEVNTMPGFTSDSLYPRLMSEAGISPDELIDLLVEDTLTG